MAFSYATAFRDALAGLRREGRSAGALTLDPLRASPSTLANCLPFPLVLDFLPLPARRRRPRGPEPQSAARSFLDVRAQRRPRRGWHWEGRGGLLKA